jgi:Protein of unknown function (DUF559)
VRNRSIRAQICRHNRTTAEIRFSEILDGPGILHECEAIFLNGDRFILADFYFKAQKLVIELAIPAHDDQKEYDEGRDASLLRGCGMRAVRPDQRADLHESGRGKKTRPSGLSL